MTDSVGRVFLGLSALAVLWIIVYWWWEPPSRVTFDPGSGGTLKSASGTAPTVEPPKERREPDAVAKPVQQTPRIAVIPPRFTEYVVKQGETIDGIAAKQLGSSKHAAAILSANAFMSPEHLKAGRVIRIPMDPTNIQGKPVTQDVQVAVTAKQEAKPEATVAPGAKTPSAPDEKPSEYVVKSGDSLSAISKKFYGTTSLTDLIFQANRDQLENEDALQQGQTLKIPPKPKR